MSLSVSYNQLQKAVGRYLGYGRNIYGADNGTNEWADIEDCINSGLRQFYTPPVLPNQQLSHQWSFLKPSAVLELTASVGDYDLPDDCNGIEGDLTYPPSTANSAVKMVSETAIRKLRQDRPETAGPVYAAVRPKSSDGSSEQVFEIIFWPVPHADISLSYRYYVGPSELSNDNPFPYGGTVHSETILQSCLSIAEQRLNDDKSIHWEKFLERLAASIQIDLKTGGGDYFGYNSDNSDRSYFQTNDRLDYVTVNGQSID